MDTVQKSDSRLVELDIVKTLAIIFMVLVHSYELYILPSRRGGISDFVIELLGSPFAAPVFMFAMGCGLYLSGKSAPHQLFKRGISLIVIGYLLQWTRDFLPRLVLGISHSNDEIIHTGLMLSLGQDIFIFAGLYFIFFAGFKRLNWPPYALLIIALLVIFPLNSLLSKMHLPSADLGRNALAGCFWGSWDNSWFPFLSWYIFPSLGYCFIAARAKFDNRKKFYLLLMTACLGLLAAGLFLFRNVDFGIQSGFEDAYYHQPYEGNIVYGLFCLFWLSVAYFLSFLVPRKCFQAFRVMSKSLSSIYLYQWLILGWLALWIPYASQSLRSVMIIFVGTTVASALLGCRFQIFESRVMQTYLSK